MKKIDQVLMVGERAFSKLKDSLIVNSVFQDGESPLKESENIMLEDVIFRWKYPLWYCKNIKANKISFVDTARSGIWYTNNIEVIDSVIQAPKTFRRCCNIKIKNTHFTNAEESMWSCEGVELEDVVINGDYFAKDSKNIKANNLVLTGNYVFDGSNNIEVNNSKFLSKDAFWNCKNVTVKNSIIIGEYIGWNSENVKFINCTIESNQGFCYMKNLELVNCKIINSDLIFEYSTVKACLRSKIKSVKNPISGNISSFGIEEIIFDDDLIKKENTKFQILEENCEKI